MQTGQRVHSYEMTAHRKDSRLSMSSLLRRNETFNEDKDQNLRINHQDKDRNDVTIEKWDDAAKAYGVNQNEDMTIEQDECTEQELYE